MKWNNQFKYPSSTRALINGARYYEINNKKLPSVTEIIKSTESEDKRQSLKQWRDRIGDAEADKIITMSSERGTAMHKYIEEHLVGQKHLNIEASTNEPYLMAEKIIHDGLYSLDELWGCEVTLSYPDLYAGTADACGVYDGIQSIIDFKQSNKPKKRQWIEDYFIQLAAYAMAHNIEYSTNISQGIILMCTPPPQIMFQKFVIDGEEFKNYQDKFLEKVNQFNSMGRIN